MNIAIYGAGAYGTALGEILKAAGHSILYYDPIKYPDQSLAAVLRSSEVNILACPSNSIGKLILFIPHDKPLICATKGFLSTGQFKDFKQFSVLSGGAFAADLLAKKPTVLTATSPIIGEIFKASWLSFEYTNDIFGVLLCGSFKNIYAIGSGYRRLNPDMPEFTDYLNAVYAEIRLILAANGCNPSTVDLSCGKTDLYITCASVASRNYRFGLNILEDPSLPLKLRSGEAHPDATTEGYSALKSLPTSSLQIPGNTPILKSIYDLVFPPVEDPKKKRS